MSAIVCEECGGDLKLDELGRVATCMQCGAQANRDRLQKLHPEEFQPLCELESKIRNRKADYFAMVDALKKKPRRLRFAVPLMLLGMFMGMGMGAMADGNIGAMMSVGLVGGILFFILGFLIGLIVDGGRARRNAKIRDKSERYEKEIAQLERRRDALYADISKLKKAD